MTQNAIGPNRSGPRDWGSSKATLVHNALWEKNNVFASNVSHLLQDRNSRTRRMPKLGDVTRSEFPQFSVLSGHNFQSGVHHCSSNELGLSFIGADVIRDYCKDLDVNIAI